MFSFGFFFTLMFINIKVILAVFIVVNILTTPGQRPLRTTALPISIFKLNAFNTQGKIDISLRETGPLSEGQSPRVPNPGRWN